jgi:D-amino-acid oxidase
MALRKPQFRVLSTEELPKGQGFDAGIEFQSVVINVALYLPYLVGQCRKNGVVLKRQILTHIADAKKMHDSGDDADVVINCTGLMASTLGGVNDKAVVPARGQIVIVRNDPGMAVGAMTSGTDDGTAREESVYYMNRACGMTPIRVRKSH